MVDKDLEKQDGIGVQGEKDQEEKTAGNSSGGNRLAIVLGIIIFIGVLVFCWQTVGKAHRPADIGVLYAKDNEIRFYDLKNEPYLLTESISNEGSYHYYYSAWGAMLSEKGEWAYYPANIDANGRFDLFRKNTAGPQAEPEKISDNVLDYAISEDGRQTAYLKAEGEKISLWLSDGAPRKISADMQLDEQSYFLSSDGKYLLYTVHETNGLALYALSTAAGSEPVELCASVEMYALADETDTVYYVTESEEGVTAH